MDYSGLKPYLSIDFIRIAFRLKARSNLQSVQPALNRIVRLSEGRNVSIRLLDKQEGGSTSHFSFDYQDPPSLAEVARVVTEIQARFELDGHSEFTAIEVAFDLYSKRPDSAHELAEVAAHLYKFSAYHPNGNHRIKREIALAVPPHFSSLVRHVQDGWQIHVGSQRAHGPLLPDPISMQAYFKTTDAGNALPIEQQRARNEYRLQGNAMPFRTLSELSCYDFGDIRALFSFRRLRDDLDPLIDSVLRERSQVDFTRHQRNRKGGGTRLNAPATCADTALNGMVRSAYHQFMKRWNR